MEPATMALILVRGLDEELKARLQQRAKRHGRSIEEEVREILRAATKRGQPAERRLGSSIAARFPGLGLAVDIEEAREQSVRPARFAK
jgi:antitoxin FitA